MSGIGPGCQLVTPSFNQEKMLAAEEAMRIAGRPRPHFKIIELCEVLGVIDPDALELAANEVLRRHVALRLGFWSSTTGTYRESLLTEMPSLNGVFAHNRWRAVIDNAATVQLRRERADNCGPCSIELRTILNAALGEPMRCDVPPLFRVIVVNVSPLKNVIALIAHRVAMDRHACQLFVNELLTTCHEISVGRAARPSIASNQFLEFVDSERRMFAEGLANASVAYWRDQWLGGLDRAQVRPSEMRFMHHDSGMSPLSVHVVSVLCEDKLLDLLYATADGLHAGIEDLFTAAFAVMLGRCTNKTNVGLWRTFSNRASPEMHEVVGHLANSHLLGIAVDVDRTGRNLVEETRTTIQRAIQHQAVPLAMMPHLCQWPKASGLRVSLEIRDDIGDARGKVVGSFHTQGLYIHGLCLLGIQLHFAISRRGGAVVLEGRFSPRIFPTAAVTHMLEMTKNILSNLAMRPDLSVAVL